MAPVGKGNNITQLERTWFESRASLPSYGFPYTVDDMKKTYFSRGSLASAGLKKVGELETEWLQLVTGNTNTDKSAMWARMVGLYTPAGAVAVSQSMSENKFNFYSLASLLA